MNAHQRTILVVDDEQAVLDTLTDALTEAGYSITTALNGREGLAKALETHPDLILLDIVMPVMDGLAMLRGLRSNDWGKYARVILLTNLNDFTHMATAVELRTYTYLVKSDWDLTDVIAKVREKLKNVEK